MAGINSLLNACVKITTTLLTGCVSTQSRSTSVSRVD